MITADSLLAFQTSRMRADVDRRHADHHEDAGEHRERHELDDRAEQHQNDGDDTADHHVRPAGPGAT